MKRTTIAAFVLLISLIAALVAPSVAGRATDGSFLSNAGNWTYGITGAFHYPRGSNAHGLNEKMPVKSLYDAHEFQYRLGKRLGVRSTPAFEAPHLAPKYSRGKNGTADSQLV